MNGQQKRTALFLFPTDTMGGAENVTLMLAKTAHDCGFFDHVICYVMAGTRNGGLDQIDQLANGELIYAGAGSEKAGIPKLLRILMKHRYDLVFSSHTHINSAVCLMRRLRLLKTKRLVTRESTMIFERDLGWFGVLARHLYRFYGSQDLIICQTDRMLDSLEKNTNGRFSDRSETIPNPIDIDSIRSFIVDHGGETASSKSEERRIAWCGRLSQIKSPLRAIDALIEVHERGHRDAHLVMMGKGPMREEIEDYLRARDMVDHVSLTGRVTQPATIMKDCELGLMTSDTEGFPNVILEMLASGVRSVVTTDCAGGLAEIPGVHLSAEKTPSSLADALVAQLQFAHRDPDIDPYLENRSPKKFLQKILQI